MARAKISLLGSLSHTSPRGRTMHRGKPVIITDPTEINYYKGAGGFDVEVLEEEPLRVKAPLPPPAASKDEGEDEEEVEASPAPKPEVKPAVSPQATAKPLPVKKGGRKQAQPPG